jgi:hypothetical protein
VYLLVSGAVPVFFYVTCRTRRWRGSIPRKQRILARWHYSLIKYTFDAQHAWQAGLATVVALFMLGWLIYGKRFDFHV